MKVFARSVLLALLVQAAVFGSAETFTAMRKRLGIRAATTVAALETLVGKRTVEIAGTVKGTISGDAGGFIYIATTDGMDLHVQAASIPEWMRGDTVLARMIIEAERTTDTGPLKARLLSAVPETEAPKFANASKISGPIGKVKIPKRNEPIPPPPSTTANWSVPAEQAVPYYKAFAKKANRRLSDSQAETIARSIIQYSLQYGVDARLIVAIVLTESDFNPKTVSHAGAKGLGQLMPVNVRELGITNVYDLEQNLHGTIKLIRGHMDKYHKKTGGDPFETLVLTLAGYNAGDGAVRRHKGVPPYRETQNYVRKVIARYRALCGEP